VADSEIVFHAIVDATFIQRLPQPVHTVPTRSASSGGHLFVIFGRWVDQYIVFFGLGGGTLRNGYLVISVVMSFVGELV